MLARLWYLLVGRFGTAPEALVERLETLEDRYNRLTRRFDRLQNEFNALSRASYDEDEEDELAALSE